MEASTFTSIEGSVVQLATPSGGFHGEAELVAQEIISRADQNWGSCAALYRTKAQSALLERELIKHQVPYSVRGGASFFARKEIYQMVFFLAAAYCNNIQAIVGYTRNEAKGIPAFAGIGNLPTLTFGKTTRYLGNASFNKLDMIFKSTVNPDIVTVVREFERSLDTRSRPGARDLGDMLQNLRAEAENPREALEWVFRNVYEPQIKLDTDDDEDAYNNKVTSIAVLHDIAAEYQDVTGFVDYCLGRMFEGFGQKDAPKNAVQLMTIHASKGLEFKNVFVLGVNDRYLPHARGELNEELRLFYVAATRAEEYLLFVSPIGIDFYGKELTPSSFINIVLGTEES